MLIGASRNPFTTFAAGPGITAIPHSVAATGLTVTGFVSARLVEPMATPGIMLGAYVGTTVIAEAQSFNLIAANRTFEDPAIAHLWNPFTEAGRAALDAVITRQAQVIAYIDDYKLLMIATLVVLPLVLVFKRSLSSRDHGSDRSVVLE